MMSWGKNFAAFNTFIFEYLPMYNKFRAPAMILVITQLTFPLLAVLGVQQFLSGKDDKTYLWKKLKLAGLFTAGVFAVLFLLYISFDYKNDRDKFIQQQLTQMSNGDSSLGRDIVNAAADDRKGLFGKDLFRSFFFIGASFLLLFLYARNKLKATPVIIGLLLLSSIDVLAVGKRYLANDNFMEPEDSDGVFLPTAADAEIKKDTEPNYRVFNLTQDPFNDAITAYHHKSIGGYHAAKLSIYQDLIENQLSKQPMNMPVLDMLNTKYIITTDSAGRLLPQRNPGALGSAWLVKSISFVKDAKAEMRALDNFNPKENAIVQESFKPSVPFMPQWDSAGTIQLVKNDNDIVTYSFNASTNQFAVFSEVYYDRGWKAFVDGKETPIVKVNYVLRGLAVPAGKHNIEFRFEPSSYKTGKQLTGISQLLILGILITGIFLEYRRSKKHVNKA
ncbi:MAG: YfhO family protein [Bacteroidia bacterium]|nr:YfhO family protein [Bacteroidia bacterium]